MTGSILSNVGFLVSLGCCQDLFAGPDWETADAIVAVVLLLTRIVSSAFGDDHKEYLSRIKPVLQARCYACHGVLKQEGGLRLDTAQLALKGADSGAVIKPSDADASSLLRRVSSMDEADRMPPKGNP